MGFFKIQPSVQAGSWDNLGVLNKAVLEHEDVVNPLKYTLRCHHGQPCFMDPGHHCWVALSMAEHPDYYFTTSINMQGL